RNVIRHANYLLAALLCVAAPAGGLCQDSRCDLNAVVARLEVLDRQMAELRQLTIGLPAQSESPIAAAYLVQQSEEPPSSLEERVKALESASRKQADEEARDREASAKKPTQRWTGRIHADYWAFPHTSAGANAFETGDANQS